MVGHHVEYLKNLTKFVSVKNYEVYTTSRGPRTTGEIIFYHTKLQRCNSKLGYRCLLCKQ